MNEMMFECMRETNDKFHVINSLFVAQATW